MISKGNAPTALQKLWLSLVAGLGPIVGYGPTDLHHLYGVTAKHNKILVGPWAIICIPTEYHQVRHLKGKRAFELLAGATEKELFARTCDRMTEVPFSDEIYNEIMRYHK